MSQLSWGNSETQYFYALTPDLILDSIEKLGHRPTGRCLPLNSMENRVYEVECENPSGEPYYIVSKFYRPGRWSREQIEEEHQFLFDLEEQSIPVITPLKVDGVSLFEMKDQKIFYCIYKKQGGRLKDELNLDELEQLGRLIGRVHQVGKTKSFDHRIKLNPDVYGRASLNFLLTESHIPAHLEKSYESLVLEISKRADHLFKNCSAQRIHGDCHIGNIIWTDDKAWLVDFDDTVFGPPVQDLWPIVPGNSMDDIKKRTVLLESYSSMTDCPPGIWNLVEFLRSFRLIHFSAWLAKRWKDPAFQQAFPQFDSPHYWEIQIQDLREQIEVIERGPNLRTY